MMTAIDRTIYRRMKRSYTPKELIEAYIPTEEERRFVSTMTRRTQNQLNPMLWIKLFPCLGYFPALDEIPTALVDHVRQALDLVAEVVPRYDHDRTLYRRHQLVREYYQILPYGKEAHRAFSVHITIQGANYLYTHSINLVHFQPTTSSPSHTFSPLASTHSISQRA